MALNSNERPPLIQGIGDEVLLTALAFFTCLGCAFHFLSRRGYFSALSRNAAATAAAATTPSSPSPSSSPSSFAASSRSSSVLADGLRNRRSVMEPVAEVEEEEEERAEHEDELEEDEEEKGEEKGEEGAEAKAPSEEEEGVQSKVKEGMEEVEREPEKEGKREDSEARGEKAEEEVEKEEEEEPNERGEGPEIVRPDGSVSVMVKYLDDRRRRAFYLPHERVEAFKERNFPEEISSGQWVRIVHRGLELKDHLSMNSFHLPTDTVLHCVITAQRPHPAASGEGASAVIDEDEEAMYEPGQLLLPLILIMVCVLWVWALLDRSSFRPSSLVILLLISGVIVYALVEQTLFARQQQQQEQQEQQQQQQQQLPN